MMHTLLNIVPDIPDFGPEARHLNASLKLLRMWPECVGASDGSCDESQEACDADVRSFACAVVNMVW